jgi:hypothetical protein
VDQTMVYFYTTVNQKKACNHLINILEILLFVKFFAVCLRHRQESDQFFRAEDIEWKIRQFGIEKLRCLEGFVGLF